MVRSSVESYMSFLYDGKLPRLPSTVVKTSRFDQPWLSKVEQELGRATVRAQ